MSLQYTPECLLSVPAPPQFAAAVSWSSATLFSRGVSHTRRVFTTLPGDDRPDTDETKDRTGGIGWRISCGRVRTRRAPGSPRPRPSFLSPRRLWGQRRRDTIRTLGIWSSRLRRVRPLRSGTPAERSPSRVGSARFQPALGVSIRHFFGTGGGNWSSACVLAHGGLGSGSARPGSRCSDGGSYPTSPRCRAVGDRPVERKRRQVRKPGECSLPLGRIMNEVSVADAAAASAAFPLSTAPARAHV